MSNFPVAIVLCRFNDIPDIPRLAGFYEDFFTQTGAGTGGCYDYWQDVTYGTVTFRESRVFDWIDLNHSSDELKSLQFPADRSTLWQWGADAARTAGIDLSGFSIVAIIFNISTDHGAAGGRTVVFGYSENAWEPTFVFHEIGHTIGLDHSWSAKPDTVYGDRWDIMSAMNVWTFVSNYGAPAGPGLNAPYLDRLGALPTSRVWTPTAGQGSVNVTLASLNDPAAPGFLTVQVPMGFLGPEQQVTYFVEYRKKQGWDRGIPTNVVLVHEVRANRLSYLLNPALTAGSAPFVNDNATLKISFISSDEPNSNALVAIEAKVAPPSPRCNEIEVEISALDAEIATLQDELQNAGPGQKAPIAAQIKSRQKKISQLRQEAAALGCVLS